MIESFTKVLHKINTDLVPNTVFISPQEVRDLEKGGVLPVIETRLQQLIVQLYAETQQRRYFRRLYRPIIDTLFVNLIKLTRPKKNR